MPNALGFDLGNLQNKVAGRYKSTLGVYSSGLSAWAPSVELGDLEVSRRRVDVIEYAGMRWVLDPGAVTSTDFNRFEEWPVATRAGLLYALSQIDSNTRKFDVVIGAPLDVLNRAEQARAATAEALGGKHIISVNGTETKITIGKTNIVSQPKAAIVTAPNWREKRTLLVDWGFVTLHMAYHTHDGRRSAFDERATTWAPIGAHVAAGELAKLLNARYMQASLSRRVGAHEADAILNGAPAELPGDEDITALKLDLLDKEFQRMVEFVETNTAQVAPNQMYFVGGCAARHRARILARWGQMAVIPARPLYAVAEGLLVIGKGLWG